MEYFPREKFLGLIEAEEWAMQGIWQHIPVTDSPPSLLSELYPSFRSSM